MDFIETLKAYLKEAYKASYERAKEINEELHKPVEPYEDYIQNVFNNRINCGGYALEADTCVFSGAIPFECAVSEILRNFPHVRLLGNTKLKDDEYIVKYRASGKGGHHFIKIKDGVATEKNECHEIRNFSGWPEGLENAPEAVFAVKKEHDILLEMSVVSIRKGLDFSGTVAEAYKQKQENFEYHCQSYQFKKDNKTGDIYIVSGRKKVADVLVEGDECIAMIREGYEDYVSNTKTNYRNKDEVETDI